MKVLNLLTFTGFALAQQITLVRPDKTTGIINSAPGCYGIYPTISQVTGTNGQKLEYYNDWNCQGQKVAESTGDKAYSTPVQAVSVRVSPAGSSGGGDSGGGSGGNPTQVTIYRPDQTSGTFSAAPGCYGIFPTVSRIQGPPGLKYEFYNDWNCKGTKVEEAIGDKTFGSPINAVSVKVVANAQQFYLGQGSWPEYSTSYYSPSPNYYQDYYTPVSNYYSSNGAPNGKAFAGSYGTGTYGPSDTSDSFGTSGDNYGAYEPFGTNDSLYGSYNNFQY